MILPFNEKFKDPILKGFKIHTIREDMHNRWKVGRTIHMATGVRTKRYNCFHESVCRHVDYIRIWHKKDGIEVRINDSLFAVYKKGNTSFSDMENLFMLAQNDGFTTLTGFFGWFNKDFRGKIIHWTDFKY